MIQPKIKALALIKRKNIVEARIEIGEIHNAAQRYNQQLRLKGFVVLQHAVMAFRCAHERRVFRSALLRNKPQHILGRVRRVPMRIVFEQSHLTGYVGHLRIRTSREAQGWMPGKSHKRSRNEKLSYHAKE